MDALTPSGSFVGRWHAGRLSIVQAFACGVLLLALQLLLSAAFGHVTTMQHLAQGLFRWDAGWYRSIVDLGYVSTWPVVPQEAELSNVAFFPLYPYLAKGVAALLGIQSGNALLVVAHLACVGFWTNFLLLLRSWKTPLLIAVPCVLAVLAFPASVFLVAPYTESLFLFLLLGYILRTFDAPRMDGAIYGILMTATRFV
jgi:hypothetical protein